MTKELNEALVAIINTTLKATETAVNFLSSELPDVVTQLILFNTVWNWFLVIAAITIMILSTIGIRVNVKSNSDWSGPLVALSCVAFVVGLITLLENIKNTILITIAPKIWLIEYASTLIKGH